MSVQQAQADGGQAPAQETVCLKRETLELVLLRLQEMPYRLAAPVIDAVMQDLNSEKGE